MLSGCKMNNINVVYTPWANLKKTGDMDVGQIGFHRQKEVSRDEMKTLWILGKWQNSTAASWSVWWITSQVVFHTYINETWRSVSGVNILAERRRVSFCYIMSQSSWLTDQLRRVSCLRFTGEDRGGGEEDQWDRKPPGENERRTVPRPGGGEGVERPRGEEREESSAPRPEEEREGRAEEEKGDGGTQVCFLCTIVLLFTRTIVVVFHIYIYIHIHTYIPVHSSYMFMFCSALLSLLSAVCLFLCKSDSWYVHTRLANKVDSDIYQSVLFSLSRNYSSLMKSENMKTNEVRI